MKARSAGWLVVFLMVGACTEVSTEAGDEQPTALCERYATAAERVILDWYSEAVPEPISKENAAGHAPAVGGPNAHEFYAMRGAPALLAYAPTVEARCSWRELNLVVEFPDVPEYFDPEIMLGSILRDLRRDKGLDAYADRMKVVVEDVDIGVYAAFDPWD